MSSRRNAYVIGAGGHAKVVIRSLQMLGCDVTSVFDDDLGECGEDLLGIPVVCPVRRIEDYPPQPTVIAIGDNRRRRLLAEQLDCEWMTLVDPRAHVDRDAHIGRGTVVLPGAIVQVGSAVGNHVIVNTNASVDHDCLVGDYVHLCPATCLAGSVSVEEGAMLGMGAMVIPGRRVGTWTMVGAGATVVKDLPGHILAMGAPANIRRSLGADFSVADVSQIRSKSA